jgi:predicted DNA-binding antitoxin AbrB/MazE fold protein
MSETIRAIYRNGLIEPVQPVKIVLSEIVLLSLL